MKFGDKLLELRKKNGLSQEELAEKLGVSRQSVSKWESNNAYPETDKIVQICNLFDCSMDDLINDNITDLKQIERKEKKVVDSFLEYITKTINMFSDMTFGSGLKCVIKMGLLALLLFFIGLFVVGITSDLLGDLFSFLKHYFIIKTIIKSILRIIWFALSVLVFLYVFNIKYLDYYVKVKETGEEDKTEKIKIENKNNVVISSKETRSYEFISTLSKIVKFFIKLFLIFIILSVLPVLVTAGITLILSLLHINISSIFVGVFIMSLSVIANISVFLIIFINYIFNKTSKVLPIIIAFLSSVVLFGVGIGICTMSFKNFKIEDAKSFAKDTEVLETTYSDNLVFAIDGLDDIDYEFDESLGDKIKVEVKLNKTFNDVSSEIEDYYGSKVFIINRVTKDFNMSEMYNIVIKDIKNNILREYDNSFFVTVKTSKPTADKLIDNASKVYYFNKKETKNGYRLEDINHLIHQYNNCEKSIDYNAFTKEMKTPENCKCEKIEQDGFIEINCE